MNSGSPLCCCCCSVGLGCRDKPNCPHEEPKPVGGVPSVGVFLRDSSPYFREFRGKKPENSTLLGRQVRPGIETDISRLPV